MVARVPISVVLAEVAPLVAMDVRSKFVLDEEGTDARSPQKVTWLYVDGRTVLVGSDGREGTKLNGENEGVVEVDD
jgi:hypothetical protein